VLLPNQRFDLSFGQCWSADSGKNLGRELRGEACAGCGVDVAHPVERWAACLHVDPYMFPQPDQCNFITSYTTEHETGFDSLRILEPVTPQQKQVASELRELSTYHLEFCIGARFEFIP